MTKWRSKEIKIECFAFQRPPRGHANTNSSLGGPAGPGRRFGAPQCDEEEMLGLEEEDDIVAADLDMHSLILTSNPQDHGVRTSNLSLSES